jgi:membrane protease YdiL (CAAX protease family)
LLPAETNGSATGSYRSADTHAYAEERDYSRLSLWQLYQEAQNNNPDAQYYYARKLERQATQADMSREAMLWYRKAAANGSVQAQSIMMQRYFLGIGVTSDIETAGSYGEKIINDPGITLNERGIVSLFLAGIAFGSGEVKEGCRFLLNTFQSPVIVAEYVVLVLLLAIAALYMYRQYRMSQQTTEQKYVWTLVDCLAAFLLLAAGTLFWECILILLVIPVLRMPYLLSAMVFSNIAILCAVLYCILLARWRGASFVDVFRLKWISWYKYPVWIFLGMWAILILRLLYSVASVVLHIPTRMQTVQHMLMQETSWATLVPIIIDGVIIAAVFEEFLFRGVVHRVLRAWLPAWTIVVISAVIFGAIHLDPWNFIPLALTGLVLAASYEMTKSLTVPILLHAANNLFGFVMMFLLRYLPGM